VARRASDVEYVMMIAAAWRYRRYEKSTLSTRRAGGCSRRSASAIASTWRTTRGSASERKALELEGVLDSALVYIARYQSRERKSAAVVEIILTDIVNNDSNQDCSVVLRVPDSVRLIDLIEIY